VVDLVNRKLIGAALLASLMGAGVWEVGQRVIEARRMDRGERPLIVVAPPDARLALYRAGATLDDIERQALDAGRTWLVDGDYFLEATVGSFRLLYPVSPRASRAGPDAGGTFHVAVRAPAFEVPPRLDEAGPPFVFIPAGPFEMGDRATPLGPHYTYVTAFFLASFEVTNGEFRVFLAAPDGYDNRASWTDAGWQWRAGGTSQATARLDPSDADFARFGRDDLPVVLVTWHEANAYCRWLTRRLGQGRWLYRMPTEAEWEKAARGPDSFDYGVTRTLSEPQAAMYNWRKNPGAATTLVGYAETQAGYRPNRYGLYHMSGNAAEWTQSVHRAYSQQQPYADDDRNLDTARGLRATRGGSWYSATTSRLLAGYGEEFQPELSSNDLGFRVAVLPLPGGSR
jgi:formylglycine-generating enzyme required for sulfatase activity